jgi:probable F420-dependent oxidoreductase
MNLGRAGVWLGSLGLLPAAEEREVARELESLGYGTLWFGESQLNKEAFAHAAMLLGWTEHVTVATGITSIWARDAFAAANGAAALGEAYPGRFVLGLGVSHAPSVEGRGHTYERPFTAMRAYLDAMDATQYLAPPPPEPTPRVIGALHPKMLALAAERTAGAHPYLVTPEHTATARTILGDSAVLAPEQAFVLTSDPAEARGIARAFLRVYLGADNYQRSWRALGFTDEDWGSGGSDRLVDALIAWGDAEAVVERFDAHLAAGADHVALQALGPKPLDDLREVAHLLRNHG